MAASGTAAACSKDRFSGLCATPLRTQTYSAKEPLRAPKTSSPGRKPSTPLPTASTVPAKSTPSMPVFGLRRPAPRRAMYGLPVSMCQSYGLTEEAWTRTSTPSSARSGLSISRSSRTSVEPNRS